MEENKKSVSGFSIAALVLGIISIVLWCLWFASIPCAILAIIFGAISLRKTGKALSITGMVTGIVSIGLWFLIFMFIFSFGFIEGVTEIIDEEYGYYGEYEYENLINYEINEEIIIENNVI